MLATPKHFAFTHIHTEPNNEAHFPFSHFHLLTIADKQTRVMNPFRCSTSSEPNSQKQGHKRKKAVKNSEDRMILVQEFIRILPGGTVEILDTWVHRNIPQDLTLNNIETTVHLDNGTILTTKKE